MQKCDNLVDLEEIQQNERLLAKIAADTEENGSIEVAFKEYIKESSHSGCIRLNAAKAAFSLI